MRAIALALLLIPLPAPGFAQTPGEVRRSVFAQCVGPQRVTCVVDGDTFWLDGSKIRIADINAPEVSAPRCAREARLGARAKTRLIELLNAGAIALGAGSRDADRYGRKLRIVSRDGLSLGAILIAEGLAETWQGRCGDWCAGA